jgi:hypothetical protein
MEIYYYLRAYPLYEITSDPYLEGPDKAVVAAVKSRSGCASGSMLDCFAIATILTLGSWNIGPVGPSSPPGSTINTVPSNLVDDVFPQPSFGWRKIG